MSVAARPPSAANPLRSLGFLAAIGLLATACGQPPGGPSAAAGLATNTALECRPPRLPATQVDLYFGRNIDARREVGEGQWAAFLSEIVTPRFPDGLTVLDTAGQYRLPDTGRIVRERGKLVILVVGDLSTVTPDIEIVREAYKKRFEQRSVLRTERPICHAF